MSYANGTQFYNLPQTVGTDKRDWFDTNSAFAAIDAALHSAVTGQATDAEAIATINGKLADDEADIAALQTKGNTHDSQIAALQTTVNTQASQIADVRQDAEDMITANNEGAAAISTRAYAIGDYFIYNDVLYKATAAIAIGDTIVPNTNCEATNVDTELTQLNSDLTGKIIASLAPTENETRGELLGRAYQVIHNLGLNTPHMANIKLVYGGHVHSLNENAGDADYRFMFFETSATGIDVARLVASSATSVWNTSHIANDGSGITTHDIASQAATSTLHIVC